MKFFSVLAVSALAVLCSVDRAAGAACTREDEEKILALVASKVIEDENCFKPTSSNDCPNAECLKTMEGVTPLLPDCTAKGKNVRSEYAAQIKKCASGGSAAASVSTSAAVALSSAAVAVAAVFL